MVVHVTSAGVLASSMPTPVDWLSRTERAPRRAFGRSDLGWLSLPDAAHRPAPSDLALEAREGMWAVNAYLIASAACIILGGNTADRTAARGAASCGHLLFTLTLAVIATAEVTAWLPKGRWTGADCSAEYSRSAATTSCLNRSPSAARSAF
jgi:MFS family permease